MARCIRTRDLDVHHKRKDGGDGMDNAEVLCQSCHKATLSFGVPGKPAIPFDEVTKQKALNRANNRCECTRTGGCH